MYKINSPQIAAAKGSEDWIAFAEFGQREPQE